VLPPSPPAARYKGRLAAQVLFALLVLATVGAFFLTTRLKRSTPVVQGLTFGRYLSPNGDGRKDVALIRFRTKRSDEVTVSIVNSEGEELRVLARDRQLNAGPHRFRWNGRLPGGGIAADGEYRVKVGLRRQRRSVTSPRKLFVDATPPNPTVRYVSPDSISPDGVGSANRARLRFVGPTRSAPILLVYRTDSAPARLVARRSGRRQSNELSWDGLVGPPGRQRPAASGNYMMVVRTRDAAGNIGPVGLPPARGRFAGHPGVIVSYVSATAPPEPARAGKSVTFQVKSDERRYRWSVRRLGSARVIERGSSRSRTLKLRAPRGRSGVFLLGLRVGAHRYEAPFAVQGRRRERVLVVLPATSWQARNPLDSDGDGFADTLPEDSKVEFQRAFAGSGLPGDFTAREVPLLLDLRARRYDITTDLAWLAANDLALAGGRSRPPVRYRGILFAGPPRFFSSDVGRLVRSYVEAGGRLAWIGTGGFTQSVRIRAGTLEIAPGTISRRRNLFGEVLYPGVASGLLTVLGDRIQFFPGVGAAFGPFPGLEESTRLPAGARLLASAGREASRPALVVYRYGQGIVARVGVDGFSRALADSRDVARIMRRLWILLSR
jgi:hypothetical protein